MKPLSVIVKGRIDNEDAEFVQLICDQYGLNESEALRCMIHYIEGKKYALDDDKRWVDLVKKTKQGVGTK